MSESNGKCGVACGHLDIKIDGQVQRCGPQGQSLIDLSVTCADCGEPFVFTLGHPSPQTIRLAILPASAAGKAEPVKRIIVPQIVGKVD